MSTVDTHKLLALMRDSVQQQVTRTGNSQAIIIPKGFRSEIGLEQGDDVLLFKPDAEPPAGLEENLVCRIYEVPEQDDAVPDFPETR